MVEIRITNKPGRWAKPTGGGKLEGLHLGPLAMGVGLTMAAQRLPLVQATLDSIEQREVEAARRLARGEDHGSTV